VPLVLRRHSHDEDRLLRRIYKKKTFEFISFNKTVSIPSDDDGAINPSINGTKQDYSTFFIFISTKLFKTRISKMETWT